MVALPELADFTSEEIIFATDRSPTIKRYWEIHTSKTLAETYPIHALKLKEWLKCSLSSIHNKLSPEEICRHWSNTCDEILKLSWKYFTKDTSTLSFFSLGKLGSQELNLSSDIDLFILINDKNSSDISIHLKTLRHWIKFLNEPVNGVFLFRTDFDLRPGGASSSLITTYTQWQTHYGYFGETWDRIAFVRLRALWGEDEIISDVISFSNKYAYRKHLDFSLIPILKKLKQSLRQKHINSGAYDIKFSPGGIRELELFVNSIQIIHGGKIKSLKTPSFSLATTEIFQHDILPQKDAIFLRDTYWFYRKLENILQATTDLQTYDLNLIPSKDFFTEKDLLDFKNRSSQVENLINDFLGNDEVNSYPSVDELKELYEIKIPGKDSELRFAEKNQFLNIFQNKINKLNIDTHLAVENLKDFLNKTRFKSTIFSLFTKHPELIDELALVFSISPHLSQTLIQRPELLDLFLLKLNQTELSDDIEVLLEQLRDDKLISELIVTSQFLKNKNILPILENLTVAADRIITSLLSKVDYSKNIIDILCLGKWGGRELGVRSDLDFVFITHEEPDINDNKSAKKILSYITSHGRGGSLYNIDLRLNPSGGISPLLVSKSKLSHFLKHESPYWLRQAYIKMRPLLGSFDKTTCWPDYSSLQNHKKELSEIKNKLLKNIIDENLIDIKFSPGMLLETEFIIQWNLMCQNKLLDSTSTLSWLEQLQREDNRWSVITKNYIFFRSIEQLHKILHASKSELIKKNSDEFNKLITLLGEDQDSLWSKLKSTQSEQKELLMQLNPLA